MDADHEARQMAEVQERLEQRFPDLDPTLVEAAIQLSASEITGPVRDYVPLLVERAARIRLERAIAGGTGSDDLRKASLDADPTTAEASLGVGSGATAQAPVAT